MSSSRRPQVYMLCLDFHKGTAHRYWREPGMWHLRAQYARISPWPMLDSTIIKWDTFEQFRKTGQYGYASV